MALLTFSLRTTICLGILGLALPVCLAVETGSAPATAPAATGPAGTATPPAGMEVLQLKLPPAVMIGTPINVPPASALEPVVPRKPLFVPKGTVNLALNKPVTASDDSPMQGELKMVTDGDKEGKEGSYVELGFGPQWFQIDLGAKCELSAIVVWHLHHNPRAYHGVVVQVADDKDFIENVRTLFNNDHANVDGKGVGKDKEYLDTAEGKLIEAKGIKARFVRLYSAGSSANDNNQMTEVEVYGIPSK